MKILNIPFHIFLNIQKHKGDDFIFEIKEKKEYLNHLGTIHACYQLALAEASSGQFLLDEFFDLRNDLIPVVRKTEAKYQKPANGILYSKAAFESSSKEEILHELKKRKRALVKIKVEILDENKNRTLLVVFEWFLTSKKNEKS